MKESISTQVSLYTVNEVAQVFRLTEAAIRRMVRTHEIPAVRIGREYRIPKYVVENMLRPITSHNMKEAAFGMWKDKKNPSGEDWVRSQRDNDPRTLDELLKDLEKP